MTDAEQKAHDKLVTEVARVQIRLSGCHTLLSEALPLVKGRLLDLNGPYGDVTIIERIVAELKGKS